VNNRKSRCDNKLSFPILSDPNSSVAGAFGLNFALSAEPIDVSRFPVSRKLENKRPYVDAMGQAARLWHHRRYSTPTDGAPDVAAI
jgi:hypothetical protein